VFILLSRGPFENPGFGGRRGSFVAGRLPPNTHFDRGPIMIALTRLNGQQFVINAEKIRYLESTPDTLVCCDTGEKLMVKESLQEVIRRAIDYARTIRRPIAD
jgi:flagellar protein FlbD